MESKMQENANEIAEYLQRTIALTKHTWIDFPLRESPRIDYDLYVAEPDSSVSPLSVYGFSEDQMRSYLRGIVSLIQEQENTSCESKSE